MRTPPSGSEAGSQPGEGRGERAVNFGFAQSSRSIVATRSDPRKWTTAPRPSRRPRETRGVVAGTVERQVADGPRRALPRVDREDFERRRGPVRVAFGRGPRSARGRAGRRPVSTRSSGYNPPGTASRSLALEVERLPASRLQVTRVGDRPLEHEEPVGRRPDGDRTAIKRDVADQLRGRLGRATRYSRTRLYLGHVTASSLPPSANVEPLGRADGRSRPAQTSARR